MTHANFSLTGPALAVGIVVYGFFAAGSAALAVIDARTKLLPNRIVFPLYGAGLAGFGLIVAILHDGAAVRHLVTAVVAMAVLYGLFYLLAMFGPMGYGDVKLAGVLGLYLGWLGVAVVFAGVLLGTLAAALVAVGIVAVRAVRRRPWRGLEIPYGPYLLAGAWAAILLDFRA
ncbi:prepilin peptidase [Actinocrinis puniceicyclus]|uniref:Prepilin peptidase n=1 Tax=Actinocrinis puniceicyclus TaxID=977794 RepID=A0A8J7WX95_9ACTN|nr:A24 family peptidase [Actinocrinis puniceicyclus]MBS2966769.1 prepilin peptidase [Actinocrinis puniceicyclus]